MWQWHGRGHGGSGGNPGTGRPRLVGLGARDGQVKPEAWTADLRGRPMPSNFLQNSVRFDAALTSELISKMRVAQPVLPPHTALQGVQA